MQCTLQKDGLQEIKKGSRISSQVLANVLQCLSINILFILKLFIPNKNTT